MILFFVKLEANIYIFIGLETMIFKIKAGGLCKNISIFA